MPRAFDSDEVGRRDGVSCLSFVENVDCVSCGLAFDSEFHAQALSVEDIDEAPVGTHICPACQFEWSSQMSGWLFYTEAG